MNKSSKSSMMQLIKRKHVKLRKTGRWAKFAPTIKKKVHEIERKEHKEDKLIKKEIIVLNSIEELGSQILDYLGFFNESSLPDNDSKLRYMIICCDSIDNDLEQLKRFTKRCKHLEVKISNMTKHMGHVKDIEILKQEELAQLTLIRSFKIHIKSLIDRNNAIKNEFESMNIKINEIANKNDFRIELHKIKNALIAEYSKTINDFINEIKITKEAIINLYNLHEKIEKDFENFMK